jgi:thioredoxin 1
MANRKQHGKSGSKSSKKSRVPRTPLKASAKNVIALSPGAVGEVTDATFDRLVHQSQLPVLVDFWAPWCGPCKAIAPALEAIAEEKKDELRIVKYNTEANSQIASELAIRSIPTIALFKDGEIADVKVGAASKAALASWIDKTLNPQPGLLSRIFG